MPRRRPKPPIDEPEDDLGQAADEFDVGGAAEYEDHYEALSDDGDETHRLVSETIEGEGQEPNGYVEEEELQQAAAPRRETRQELLGRLMRRLLLAREQVHASLEQVRDFNTQLREAGPRHPEKLKEQFHGTIEELSNAHREENFARSELIQMLGWRG